MVNFGDALDALKSGRRVARADWIDRGIFVWLTKGTSPDLGDSPEPESILGVPFPLFDVWDAASQVRMPYLTLRTAEGAHIQDWVPSQADMLAIDWEILPVDL